MNNEILTATEAAELFKISVAYLRILASNGEIPGVQIGSEWRFLKTDLIDYLRERGKREQADRRFQFSQNQQVPKTLNKRGRPRKNDVIAHLHNKPPDYINSS